MHLQQAFIEQLNQHQRIIHKVCNLYVEEESGRQDLFQEITLQAWKAFPMFKGEAKFSTWLYRIALNTAITHYRKTKNKINTVTVNEFPEHDEPKEYIEEQTRAMYKAIAELSKIDKALVMLYMEDYSYQEIGEMLGITANNVAVKMNRIKTRLKEQTQKYYQL